MLWTIEGPSSKPDWRKRISLHGPQMKSVVFSSWVRGSMSFGIPALNHSFSVVTAASILQKQSSEISRFARRAIKRVRIAGKPGQPRGKLRKKKKTVLLIHERPVIHPTNVPNGATFKGFCRYTVQEIIFEPHNIQYHL